MSPLPSPMLPLPRLSFSCANGWHHVRRSRQSMVAGCARHGPSAPASSAAMPGPTPRPSWRSAAAMRAACVRSRRRGAGVPCGGHGGWGRGPSRVCGLHGCATVLSRCYQHLWCWDGLSGASGRMRRRVAASVTSERFGFAGDAHKTHRDCVEIDVRCGSE